MSVERTLTYYSEKRTPPGVGEYWECSRHATVKVMKLGPGWVCTHCMFELFPGAKNDNPGYLGPMYREW